MSPIVPSSFSLQPGRPSDPALGFPAGSKAGRRRDGCRAIAEKQRGEFAEGWRVGQERRPSHPGCGAGCHLPSFQAGWRAAAIDRQQVQQAQN